MSTDPLQPSTSLMKTICYPDFYESSSTDWIHGCKHETEAQQECNYQMKTTHKSFTITHSGLVLDPMYRFMQEDTTSETFEACIFGCIVVRTIDLTTQVLWLLKFLQRKPWSSSLL